MHSLLCFLQHFPWKSWGRKRKRSPGCFAVVVVHFPVSCQRGKQVQLLFLKHRNFFLKTKMELDLLEEPVS